MVLIVLTSYVKYSFELQAANLFGRGGTLDLVFHVSIFQLSPLPHNVL